MQPEILEEISGLEKPAGYRQLDSKPLRQPRPPIEYCVAHVA
jgi:hypothetical protein